jgi:tetratricopeptide (TPR) repeat protein
MRTPQEELVNKQILNIRSLWRLWRKSVVLIALIDACTVLISCSQIPLTRGVYYSLQGQQQRAIVEFNEALKRDWKNYKIYECRGIAYNLLGQHEKAIDDFNQAIRLSSDIKPDVVYRLREAAYKAVKPSEKVLPISLLTVSVHPGLAP